MTATKINTELPELSDKWQCNFCNHLNTISPYGMKHVLPNGNILVTECAKTGCKIPTKLKM